MKVVKRELPEGVRKRFEVKVGKKIKIINSLYADTVPKKQKSKKHIV